MSPTRPAMPQSAPLAGTGPTHPFDPPPGEEEKIVQETVDIIGIGFGPANLALAIALEDHNRTVDPQQQLSAVFLERHEQFSWHPDMLLPGASMQISFLKDLVTFRDPTHPLSFLCYLKEKGRLEDFVNKQTFFPSRHEFSDYLGWAAAQSEENVRYGTTVEAVETAGDQAVVTLAGGEQLRARAVAHAPGLVPVLPLGLPDSPRIFHTSSLLRSLTALPEPPRRVAVVGAGESAAEAVQYLHATYPGAEVHAIFTKVGYTPADDSSFANRIFDSGMVDRWFGAPEKTRTRLFEYHKGTNYSAVDPEVIDDLYQREYEEKVSGRRRLHVHNCTQAVECELAEDAVLVHTVDLLSGERSCLTVDAVVYGTGYREADPRTLFGASAQGYLTHGDQPAVTRDYRWEPAGPQPAPDVYLNGGVEHSHGLTSSLLSNLALRSEEILDSLVARASARRGS